MWDIRRCKGKDVFLLQEMSVQTYYETFGGSSTIEDMQQYLDGAYNTRKLMDELKNPNTLFFFALWDGELAGYMKLNLPQAQSDINDPESMEIERFYIAKRFQRKKLGSKLMGKAMEVAREQNKTYLWLGVWENNYRAQRFYRKMGFQIFGKHPFQMGSKTETDLLMRKDLTAGTGESPDFHYGSNGNGYGL